VALLSIPDRLFAEDPYRAHGRTEGNPKESLPDLCDARFPSEEDVIVRRTMEVPYIIRREYPDQIPSGMFLHTITTYRDGGAERFMTELSAAVTACPTTTVGEVTYHNRVLRGPRYGDQSLLFEVTFRVAFGNRETRRRIVSVFRVGDAVGILYEVGWEGSTPNLDFIERQTDLAVKRLRARQA
jgi:hypothetical protein